MPEMKTLTINGETYTVACENQLTVTITATSDTTGTSSHTPKQIYDHVQNGGTVVCYSDGVFCQVDNIAETLVLFHAGGEDLNGRPHIVSFKIDADGNVVVSDNALAVESDIGDISTAFDSIIAIQNELIGGGET